MISRIFSLLSVKAHKNRFDRSFYSLGVLPFLFLLDSGVFSLETNNKCHLLKMKHTLYLVLSTFSFLTLGIFGSRADLNVGLLSREKTCIGYSVKAKDLVYSCHFSTLNLA